MKNQLVIVNYINMDLITKTKMESIRNDVEGILLLIGRFSFFLFYYVLENMTVERQVDHIVLILPDFRSKH